MMNKNPWWIGSSMTGRVVGSSALAGCAFFGIGSSASADEAEGSSTQTSVAVATTEEEEEKNSAVSSSKKAKKMGFGGPDNGGIHGHEEAPQSGGLLPNFPGFWGPFRGNALLPGAVPLSSPGGQGVASPPAPAPVQATEPESVVEPAPAPVSPPAPAPVSPPAPAPDTETVPATHHLIESEHAPNNSLHESEKNHVSGTEQKTHVSGAEHGLSGALGMGQSEGVTESTHSASPSHQGHKAQTSGVEHHTTGSHHSSH